MQSNFGILSMIQQGYYATYPLLFISVVCLAIIFERVWALWGVGPKTAKLADALIPQLRTGKFNEALQATQARATAAERIFHTLISGSQTMDRDHLLELDDERRYQEGLEHGHRYSGGVPIDGGHGHRRLFGRRGRYLGSIDFHGAWARRRDHRGYLL
jgi:hypothetical protein